MSHYNIESHIIIYALPINMYVTVHAQHHTLDLTKLCCIGQNRSSATGGILVEAIFPVDGGTAILNKVFTFNKMRKSSDPKNNEQSCKKYDSPNVDNYDFGLKYIKSYFYENG
uniref:Uncharacterized protein n=1 Tax=Micrurus lemniscatus lemniscatus TaxID=129467 RepID=A0A2D4J0B6_MICLE